MSTLSNDKLVDSFSPAQMTQIAEELGNYKVNKHPSSTILSAILAGVFISIAFVFYITATTGTATVAFGLAKLVGGICFSLGLMLVVCCGTDLFTSTILTILPKMTHRISWVKMFRNWIFVYIGNFIGAILFVAIIWFSGQYMVANGLWGLNVLQTADHKLHHTFIEAVFLGLLANLMVCLAAWMSYAGRSLLDKMLIMVLPVAMFVASGFEHSIANMFMIPMGIVINNFASPEFWAATGVSPDTFKALTVEHFIVNNLIPVTIGNILGGLLVALPNWALHLRGPH
ncbi:formate transporter FocA [Gilliamella apicola]|uniref:Formate transporter FocA n=1 Tax=Gilliamella apicola TaxID=1196095 RepID=A0A556RKL3_9GAMM|nr:formate transporter FocA [Gilliamella sp. N-G2]OTQ77435.1 formate transporter FocA [Gilliamella sp. N-W3]TSJ89374.1 formate transporter FocA [Gilliamella apicola]